MTGSYPVTGIDAQREREFLEDNIGTVAFHLGQPGARLSVDHDKGGLHVDPGEVLAEISRRLGSAQGQDETITKTVQYWDGECARITGMYFDALNEIKALKSASAKQPRCKNCGDPIVETFCGTCREMGCASNPVTSTNPAGRPNPEVVAAVQQALMKHPHFEGGSARAFGFANTAIDAYRTAVSSYDKD